MIPSSVAREPGRGTILAMVTLFWALVFLPGLGTIEIQGEEGRRILPGITMVESGDWVVPKIGGKVYQRKPPLINWMAATSFSVTGIINEWTARLPSALVTLALGLAVAGMTLRPFGPWGALGAAAFTLGNISMIEKGRLAEIEAVYMVLTGLAVLWWCMHWLRGSSAWLRWLPAGVFLGFGWLAKGPLLMLFFYGSVIPTLWHARRRGIGRPIWRELLGAPHLASLAIMLAIFAAWAVANLRATAGADTGAVWLEQFTSRVSGEEDGGGFDFLKWARNFPRTILNFLPWALLLPLLWRRGIVENLRERDLVLFLGLRGGMVVSFFILLLPPGSSSRFAMPMLIMPALLLAMVFAHGRDQLPSWLPTAWRRVLMVLCALLLPAALACVPAGFFSPAAILGGLFSLAVIAVMLRLSARLNDFAPLLLASMALITAVIQIYATGVMPRLRPYDDVRPVARALQKLLPQEETLFAVDPGFQPVLFYLRTPLVQVGHRNDVPDEARLLLVREHRLDSSVPRHRTVAGEPLMRVAEEKRQPMLLIELEPVPDRGESPE